MFVLYKCWADKGDAMAFDPQKWGDAVEHYFGKRWGRLLMRLAILAFLVGVIATGSIIFFDKFVGEGLGSGLALPHSDL